jgi:hypothetical protein
MKLAVFVPFNLYLVSNNKCLLTDAFFRLCFHMSLCSLQFLSSSSTSACVILEIL